MSKKKATAEQVVRWIQDADQFQLRWVMRLADGVSEAKSAARNLLDAEEEPF